VSRRSRPAKAPLNREAIVSTALDILERDGLAGLSLRRVATALDTGAASLYVYLKNLNELHALMLDQALAEVRPLKGRGCFWRDSLKALLLSYRRVLLKRRGLAHLAMSTIATGPNSLRIWELLLRHLRDGGAEDANAALGVDLLTLYVTAIVAEQDNWRTSGHGVGRVRKAISAVSEKQFPLLFALKDAMLSVDSNGRLHWALDILIDGIVGSKPPLTQRAAN
jgi:AcrR family transcriptional regulator